MRAPSSRRWLVSISAVLATAVGVAAAAAARRSPARAPAVEAIVDPPADRSRRALGVAAPAPPGEPAASLGPAARPSTPPPEDEAIRRIRAAVDAAPAVAVALAREDESAHPESPFAEERSLLEMRALVHLGEIAAARIEATAFFERHPDSPLGASVFRLTGVHPVPRLPQSR
jgi:hypothetical protein